MKDRGPKLKRRHDEVSGADSIRRRSDDLGDSFPNDYLEVAILFVVGLALFGSVIALYHLWEQASV